MTDERLQAIKARCEAATPGPWQNKRAAWQAGMQRVLTEGRDVIADTSCGTFDGEQCRANADFIAHARQDVPALVAEVERLWNLIRRAADADVDDLYDEAVRLVNSQGGVT